MKSEQIMGSEVKVGQVIKVHGRIYTITDIEEPGPWHRDTEGRTTSGEHVEFLIFADSDYELRRDPGRARPRIVKVSLPPELAARVERHRLAQETTPAAIVRLTTQALDDWHPKETAQ